MDSRIIKPKVDSKGNPKDPADMPILRTYQRYNRFIRAGKTPEQAAELALREPGICHKILKTVDRAGQKCGAPAHTAKSYVCRDCHLAELREDAREMRRNAEHWVDKVCNVCRKKFRGHRERRNCDEHTQVRTVRRKDAGRPHVWSKKDAAPPKPAARALPVVVKSGNPNLPDTWDRPLPEHLRELPKPKPVVVPPGFKVKIIPTPDWRRSE